MHTAASKSDPVWDASGSDSWVDESGTRNKGTKASNAPIAEGERKRFKITVPECHSGWNAYPLQLGVATADWVSGGDHVDVTRNSVWHGADKNNNNALAIMTYTYHHMLAQDYKIHERTDKWN